MLDTPTGSISQFYNNPLVQKALNVFPPRKWVECIPGAGRRRRLQQVHSNRRQLAKLRLPGQLLLDNDQPASVVPYVADLLDNAKIRVLIYNGDRDMTTNSQGSEILLDNMVWNGAPGWANISEFQRGVWLPNNVGNQLGGYIKQHQNLQFLVVYNSGHLVPFNQDAIALELVTRFLGNTSFLDKPLPKFHVHRTHPSQLEDKKVHNNAHKIDRAPNQRTFLRKVGSASFLILIGFVSGYLVSFRFRKGRSLYQVIPNN
jgi:Serine carboxypeptidase